MSEILVFDKYEQAEPIIEGYDRRFLNEPKMCAEVLGNLVRSGKIIESNGRDPYFGHVCAHYQRGALK